MKITTKSLLLAACAVGVVAFSAKLATANDTAAPAPKMSCSHMSCCGGMMAATEPVSDVNTNIVPDLLKTCPVSGDKLGGDMGKPFVMVYQGQEVKFCCPSCKKDFDKDPAKYMALIRAADKPAKN